MHKAIIFSGIILFLATSLCLAEELTITTYYPSPFGVYNQLNTNTLGVGDNDGVSGLTSADAPDFQTNPGDVWIAGDVGIGTNSPDAKLDVAGTVRLGRGIAESWFPYTNDKAYVSGNEIIFRKDAAEGHAETMRITSSGNVGIGTVNPTQKLDVNGKVKGTELCIGSSCKASWPTLECTTRSVYANPAYVYCPLGYTRTGGGAHFSNWNVDRPITNGWTCSQHTKFGKGTCYVVCCRIN